jgi:hypothetical protein
MRYRFLTYREAGQHLSLHVDVMADGPDIVLVPSEASWRQSAPAFARDHRDQILDRLKNVKWNRELVWDESDLAACATNDPATNGVPGSIELTPGGRFIEQLNLFAPGTSMSFAEARMLWSKAEEQFAAQASGRVTLFVSTARPNSMFNRVSLPALQRNPNVTLDFK